MSFLPGILYSNLHKCVCHKSEGCELKILSQKGGNIQGLGFGAPISNISALLTKDMLQNKSIFSPMIDSLESPFMNQTESMFVLSRKVLLPRVVHNCKAWWKLTAHDIPS